MSVSGPIMYKLQPQELWRSSRDFITASTDKELWRSSPNFIWTSTDKENPSPRSLGASIQMNKAGSVQGEEGYSEGLQEMVGRYHSHTHDGERVGKCSSIVMQRVEVPVGDVWSVVRRFDEPQMYKQFIRSCLIRGEGDLKVKVGCVREIRVVSGLPAENSIERLDILDEEEHILSFSIVGGEHRLINYRSITTLHETLINGKAGTIVIESYVVDVPQGNTKEETCLLVDTILERNLQSLARVSKRLITTQRCL